MSWGLSEAQGKFQGPRYAQGARGVSWCHKYMAPCIYGSMRDTAPCIYGSMCIRLHAYMAPCVYGSMCIWLHVYMAPCIYGTAHIWCALPLLLAHSPHSSLLPAHPLAPCHPEVVGIPIHTKLFICHWEPAGSELEGAGTSWE